VTVPSRTVSLVAERAVRYLKERAGPVDSVRLAGELLATRTSDELAARRVLECAFGGDARLAYGSAGWALVEPEPTTVPSDAAASESDRTLAFLRGDGAAGRSFRLASVSVLRLRGDDVVAACGGDTGEGPASRRLKRAVTEILRDSALVTHDPPGALLALERWLGEPVGSTISLRRLAEDRLGLRATHDFADLASHLGLRWRDSDDPIDQAEALDACLTALRRPGESLDDLRWALARNRRPLDWSRFAFDRSFLRGIPRLPGTYRFFDAADRLLYVGKSRNLRRRIGSYFREGARRAPRVQELLGRLYRIEYEHAGSELEALLCEAEQIRARNPEKNVQRRLHARPERGARARLRSILILEPGGGSAVLRAYLIHEGRLVARVPIGPRGGGLRHVERVLDDYFFFAPDGPTPTPGPDLDVELIVRWLAANRDRAVAFDPTNLGSAREVTDRLRWFLGHGSPFDADGTPIFTV
jgi:hypothetical protein